MKHALTVSLAVTALLIAATAQADDDESGFFFHETDARITTPLGSLTESDSGEDFSWSAGVGVTVFETFNLRLEYEQFDFENIDDANALWLTGSFRF